jgi:hypothetical protein
MTKDKALEIENIICFLNGELSLTEMEYLNDLIKTSDENIETFRNIRDIWILTSEQTPLEQYDLIIPWGKVERVALRTRKNIL